MAVIHHTTLKPTKLELVTSWLPSRPWYRGGAAGPVLVKAGGFRLDDPSGEVGIEFMVVTDTSGDRPTTYLVPLTYRGAPLEGAEHALVGTMEHGVLGRRWTYDGCRDAVLVAALTALIEGRAQAQDQDVSDAPAQGVVVSGTGGDTPFTDFTVTDDREGTALATPQGATLRLHRVLEPAPDGPPSPPHGPIGHVTGSWATADGTRTRAVFAVLHGSGPA
ncbi:maltokinase N-terminal cap-like domain-containing protein [Streptomyces indiaensis]|uniref:Maltokinase N-terminal cap domain-containing protein n=1 Tax=Streptomyces indiaensis TaxID=284033 RepID=A0ABN3EBM2_9ACTN|nr:1,4-alpha-glucan branching protein [Streptomyces indiaensis]MCF1647785.1 1,4-alpha-glucan branching protein [Streptomyces indiaensis]